MTYYSYRMIFAASPTITRPPPPSHDAQQGETIRIECEAIGVPTPLIIWRLNWGHVGKPPRVRAYFSFKEHLT